MMHLDLDHCCLLETRCGGPFGAAVHEGDATKQNHYSSRRQHHGPRAHAHHRDGRRQQKEDPAQAAAPTLAHVVHGFDVDACTVVMTRQRTWIAERTLEKHELVRCALVLAAQRHRQSVVHHGMHVSQRIDKLLTLGGGRFWQRKKNNFFFSNGAHTTHMTY